MQNKVAILFYDLFAETDSTNSFCWICKVAHIKVVNGHIHGAAQVLLYLVNRPAPVLFVSGLNLNQSIIIFSND